MVAVLSPNPISLRRAGRSATALPGAAEYPPRPSNAGAIPDAGGSGRPDRTPPAPSAPAPASPQARRALQCDETDAGWHGRELRRGRWDEVRPRCCSGAGLSRLMRRLSFFSRHPRPCGEDPDSRSLPLATGSLDPRDKPEGDGKKRSQRISRDNPLPHQPSDQSSPRLPRPRSRP